MCEKWLDIRIVPKDVNQRDMLRLFVMPVLERLDKKETCYRTFHFLYESEGFLFRVAGEENETEHKIIPIVKERLAELGKHVKDAYSPVERGGQPYIGEEDFYKPNGWKSMEMFLEYASRVALFLEEKPPENGTIWQLERMSHCLYNAAGLTLQDEISLGIKGVFQLCGCDT